MLHCELLTFFKKFFSNFFLYFCICIEFCQIGGCVCQFACALYCIFTVYQELLYCYVYKDLEKSVLDRWDGSFTGSY